MVQLLCCSESWGQYHLAIFKRAILKIEGDTANTEMLAFDFLLYLRRQKLTCHDPNFMVVLALLIAAVTLKIRSDD